MRNVINVNLVLMTYSWVIIAILLFFLFLIARFYERKAHQKSHYQLFLLPLILFLLGALRYNFLFSNNFVGDLLGDTLFFAGGVATSILGYRLLNLMTGGRV
jgi:hypothetical protein